MSNDIGHPHFEYPQFKHVAHPSITMTAVVLHLWQRVAPAGKPEESEGSVATCGSAVAAGAAPAADSPEVRAVLRALWAPAPARSEAMSVFFFERDSYAARFS